MKKLVLIPLALCLSGVAYAQFDSLNVRFVGNWPFGSAYAVAYDSARSLVFCGSGGGVIILDVSNRSEPVKVSEDIRTRGESISDLFYDESSENLYVIASFVGLEIWDVSDPSSPSRLGSYRGDHLSGVFVSGSYAYAIGWGFCILDISSPSSPQKIGSLEMYGDDLFVSDPYAYVAADLFLAIVDISNPENPQYVSGWAPSGDHIHAHDVYASDTIAYLCHGYPGRSGFEVIDVSDPSDPKGIGSYESDWTASEVYVYDDFAYVATSGELVIVDMSDPTSPYEVGNYKDEGSPAYFGVCVFGPYAYVTGNDLVVLDITTPSEPEKKGAFDVPGGAVDVCTSGAYSFIVDLEGLRVIDVSEIANPYEVGHCSTRGQACEISISGSLACIADGDSGLSIVDISTPSLPQEVGYRGTSGEILDVCVVDNYAYVADKGTNGLEGGLRIIDVSYPAEPLEVGYCDDPKEAIGVYVSGSYAYVTDGSLWIIDVSAPTLPVVVGYYNTPDYSSRVYVSGSYAYLGESDGTRIVDISDPSNPQEIGYCSVSPYDPNAVFEIHVSGSYVCTAEHVGGLRVIDVSTPSDPHEVGFYETPHHVNRFYGVYAKGPYIYIACPLNGLQIFHNTLFPGIEETPESMSAFISPSFNCLSYDVLDQAQLTLYSAEGRKVLTETIQGKGTWEAPVHLPQGVYFARVLADSRSIQTKLILLH